jgi:hypothetical protein
MLRAMAVGTIDALWKAIGEICELFSPEEYRNYFDAAEYGFTCASGALGHRQSLPSAAVDHPHHVDHAIAVDEENVDLVVQLPRHRHRLAGARSG